MIFSHKIIIHFVSGVKGGESKKNKIKDETEGNENEMFGEKSKVWEREKLPYL